MKNFYHPKSPFRSRVFFNPRVNQAFVYESSATIKSREGEINPSRLARWHQIFLKKGEGKKKKGKNAFVGGPVFKILGRGRGIPDGIPNSLNEMDRIACFPSRNFLRIRDDEKPFFPFLFFFFFFPRKPNEHLNRGNEGEKFRENSSQQSPPSPPPSNEINRWNTVFNPFSRISLIFFLRHAFSLHSLARRFFEIFRTIRNKYIYI